MSRLRVYPCTYGRPVCLKVGHAETPKSSPINYYFRTRISFVSRIHFQAYLTDYQRAHSINCTLIIHLSPTLRHTTSCPVLPAELDILIDVVSFNPDSTQATITLENSDQGSQDTLVQVHSTFRDRSIDTSAPERHELNYKAENYHRDKSHIDTEYVTRRLHCPDQVKSIPADPETAPIQKNSPGQLVTNVYFIVQSV